MKIRKLVSIILSILLITFITSTPAFADNSSSQSLNSSRNQTIILLETNNDDVGVEIFINDNVILPMSYKSTSRTVSGRFYLKSTNDTLGNFKCTGYFNYDGTICNVTDVQASTSNCADGYKMEYDTSKNQVSPTYACATGEFRLYKLGWFGSESLQSTAVINIFCNQNGTITEEFNSD